MRSLVDFASGMTEVTANRRQPRGATGSQATLLKRMLCELLGDVPERRQANVDSPLSLRHCKIICLMKVCMATATLTSKGQITIPLKVRQKLGLDAGDRVEFVEVAPGEFALKAATEDVRSLKGMICRPISPVSIDAMNAAIQRRGASR